MEGIELKCILVCIMVIFVVDLFFLFNFKLIDSRDINLGIIVV